jgi:protein SCO1/2
MIASKWLSIPIVVLFVAFCIRPSLADEQSNSSLFSVDLKWQDDSGAQVKLEKYKGHFIVMTMAYTACTAACPLTVERLRSLEKKLADKTDRVEFVLVTFDPSRDSPQALASYKEKHNLKSKHWHFLSGTEQDTRMLAHLLEIAYEKNPKTGEIMHSNKIILLDREGSIETVVDGLNSDTKAIVDGIQ